MLLNSKCVEKDFFIKCLHFVNRTFSSFRSLILSSKLHMVISSIHKCVGQEKTGHVLHAQSKQPIMGTSFVFLYYFKIDDALSPFLSTDIMTLTLAIWFNE